MFTQHLQYHASGRPKRHCVMSTKVLDRLKNKVDILQSERNKHGSMQSMKRSHKQAMEEELKIRADLKRFNDQLGKNAGESGFIERKKEISRIDEEIRKLTSAIKTKQSEIKRKDRKLLDCRVAVGDVERFVQVCQSQIEGWAAACKLWFRGTCYHRPCSRAVGKGQSVPRRCHPEG